MPAHMQGSLIFHYNLKFYDSDGDSFDGVSLKRFVMQVIESVFLMKFQFPIDFFSSLWLVIWLRFECTHRAVVPFYWTFSQMQLPRKST